MMAWGACEFCYSVTIYSNLTFFYTLKNNVPIENLCDLYYRPCIFIIECIKKIKFVYNKRNMYFLFYWITNIIYMLDA
jgi:hypothetical protein